MRFFQRPSRNIIIFLLAVLSACSFVTSQSFADTSGQAITASPAVTQIAVDPGGTTTNKLDIVNSGTIAYKVTVSVSPYRVVGVDYDPQFTQLPGTVDPSKWVTLSQTNASAAPHAVLTVNYSVTVPKNTAPGGYYAVIFAETSPTATGGGVIAHNRVGNILYITVRGQVKQGGALSTTRLPVFDVQSSLPMNLTVSNTGGVHYLSTATFTVKNRLTGKTVFHASYDRYILPQTKRLIASSWTPAEPFGIYTISRSATIVGNTKSSPTQTIVYMKPWFFVTVCIIVVVLLALLIRRAMYHARQRR